MGKIEIDEEKIKKITIKAPIRQSVTFCVSSVEQIIVSIDEEYNLLIRSNFDLNIKPINTREIELSSFAMPITQEIEKPFIVEDFTSTKSTPKVREKDTFFKFSRKKS